ncbi:ethylene-insensitive protein 2.2 [Lycium barbarum]|uniref:ethylene-insensitive protein 2.2 n=1 Tax=Lycium barbarum TaxID=112863 RepID=UPI00293F3050|nr:ethylene-insensitive protein 2.2 [Lycium barbarum]XP_060201542.1 ethylene-insensitive protein 2.2 [Lycium barbarum]
MESETRTIDYRQQSSMIQRILSASVPMLLITVGYVDPGKWSAMVDGGARFGFDLIMLVLLFNFAAILCQYLSACIALVTDRDLAQICSEEYDKVTCIFLGIQAEVSLIALDLTLVLGTAHGLNVVFGIDLFSCVFLAATGALFFPLLSSLVDNGSAKFLCIGWVSSVLLSYVFGVVISQPETPFSIGGMLNKFSGESAFVLMSLLGASIMPHNFYLHSSIVQQGKESTELSRGALCQDHFFAIVFVFSGIFLVNYAVMNSAANVSYSTGLLLLTFQDALSLLNQVFRSSVAPFTIMLVTFISNQVTPLTCDLGRQAVVHDLFGMDIPGWLHHVTIRVISIVPALYCVWNSGAEGVYQLLIFTQVVVALVLPSSVIPLFRVASSRSIMGIHKISQLMEFLSLGTFIGLLGLKIIFVIEMIFGNSDWVNNLKWNGIGSSVSTPYVFLLTVASLSLCLMLWLAVTPLKSASSRFDAQAFLQMPMPESYPECNQLDASNTNFGLERSFQKQEGTFHVEKCDPDLSTSDLDQILPESLLDFEKVHHLATIDESKSETTFSAPAVSHPEISSAAKSVGSEVSDVESVDTSVVTTESVDVVEKTLRIEGEMENDRDDGDSWEGPEEATKGVSENAQSFISDGPGSYKSLGGKTEDTGSGTGSLSRLAGLGRAARRQLTEVLNEFWGQLFDYHGAATQEAKFKKLDIILGLDSKMNPKPSPSSLKVESSAYIPSGSARVPESLINSNMYSPKQQQFASGIVDSANRVPKEPGSMWSSHMKLLDAYVQQSSNSNILDSGERRYSSMRIPATSAGYDQQPATVHGYQITAYLNQIAKERGSDYLNGQQMESPSPRSVSSLSSSNYAEPFARSLGQKPQSGVSSRAPPGFGNVPVARNNSMQQPVNTSTTDLSSTENAESLAGSANSKKYYSLPDISGRYVPRQDSSLTDGRAQWYNNSMGYGQSIGRSTYEQAYMSGSLRTGGGHQRYEHSPKVCRDAFSLQYSSNPGMGSGSLWSRQPFEQFGVAGKPDIASGDQGAMQNSSAQESTSTVDLEAKLLQSFRSCIVKLLKLEGSEWLFRQDDGADEDLIDRIAARERFLYEAETREISRLTNSGESQFSSNRKPGSASKPEEMDYTKFLVMSVPHCGEGCVWKVDLIASFGVWCIHRILELSLMESRPELWGKYTYVLNRLQGIIELAFSKPRSPTSHCFCLQIPVVRQQQKSSPPPISNGNLPPQAKQGRGKCTTAPMLLDMIKDVEMAISCRKGRTGTAAGDVAFPKGKENLASVLKRYKRRLSNKPVGNQEAAGGAAGPRKSTLSPSSAPFGL